MVGSFVLDNMATDEPSGVVRAFDVLSGRQVWSWDAGRADPNAEPEPGDTYVRGSPNAWSLFSADEKLGLVYIPTGNAPPDYYGAHRTPEMERYSSSVVALDVNTGKVHWSFQTVHHDLWDYDVASQPVLVDLPLDEAGLVGVRTLARLFAHAGELGARVILTGIGPDIAQTLVQLDRGQLQGITARGTLQAGIAEALARAADRGRPT